MRYAGPDFGNEFQSAIGSTGGHYKSLRTEIVALGCFNVAFLDARPLTGAGHNIPAVDADFLAQLQEDIAAYDVAGMKVLLTISYGTLDDPFNIGGDIVNATGWSNLLSALATLIDPMDTDPTVLGFRFDEVDPSVAATYRTRTSTLRSTYPYVRTLHIMNIGLGAFASNAHDYTTDMGMDFYFYVPTWTARTRAQFESNWDTLESWATNGQKLWVVADTYIDAASASSPGVAASLANMLDAVSYHLAWASVHPRVEGLMAFCYPGDPTATGPTPLYGIKQINDPTSLAYSPAVISRIRSYFARWWGHHLSDAATVLKTGAPMFAGVEFAGTLSHSSTPIAPHVSFFYMLEADWDNTGLFDNARSQIHSYVLHLEASRGRNDPNPLRGRSEPGRLTVTLDNRSGLFSPQNALSSLYGKLLPGREIRWSSIFPSYAQRWQGKIVDYVADRWDGVPVITIEARGSLADLENVRVNPPADTGSLTGTIVGKVLDAAGWSASKRTIDGGQTTTSQWFVNDRFALDALREMEETELGLVSESPDGNIVFRDRAYRVSGARLTPRAEYSDAPGADFPYSDIKLPSPIKDLVNRVRATVTPYSTAALAVLWTLSETPTIGAGQTKIWIATVSNPVLYVAAWTTPVSGTDYTVSGVALGDLAVTVVKNASTMQISVKNNHVSNVATLTLLQARGTAVSAGSPTIVVSEDTTSQGKYGVREYPLPSVWLPNTNTAQSYADSIVAAHKDPLATPELKFAVSIGAVLFTEIMARDIGDRVTVIAQQPRTGIGLAGDFFIEFIKDVWDVQHARHDVTMQLSQATAGASSWILGTSVLGTSTYLGF